MFQQVLLRPSEYSVLATTNLNGDYISDALAAQVGGLGMAPGSNESDEVAIFEATHGTAPKYANQDVINPDRKSTRLNSSHGYISYAVFCLKKKKKKKKKQLHKRIQNQPQHD